MNKNLIAILILVTICSAPLSAINLAIGLTYGADIEEAGIYLGALLDITRKLRVGPDFSFYFTEEDRTIWEINLNMHYCFVSSGDLKMYILGGGQFAYSSVDYGTTSSSDAEIGINVGAGVEYRMDKFRFFLEPKYTFRGMEQFSITLGGRFSL